MTIASPAGKPKILIADPQYDFMPLVPDNLWQRLSARFAVVRNPHKKTLNQEELLTLADNCVGVVAGMESYTEEVLAKLPKLSVISRTGAGLDSIDLKAAARHGVTIKDCGDVVTEPVAELTVGLILAMLRKIFTMNQSMHENRWEQQHGDLLEGKTVGIIGLGRIGKRVSLLLRPFNCKILGYDINPDRSWIKENNISLVSLEEIYARSDIISVHIFLVPENRHLIGEQAFAKMKKGVYFLNLSRGVVVDETALIKYLGRGYFSGVALDVFEHEPYHGDLAKFDTVILTPHVGASTERSRYLMETKAIENLMETLQ